MKKKIILFGRILILLFIILIIKFFPFGTEYSKNTVGKLIIPKLSIFEEECCMFSANYKSVRSKYILQKELDKTIKSYKNCNGVYYDEKNNISITDYGVERGFVFNYFYIIYDKGNYCEKIEGTKQLTLDDVIELSKKGEDINNDDFEDYLHTSIGYGMVIDEYKINENYKLIVGHSYPKPLYVKLRYIKDKTKEDYKEIDIRTDNIEKFIHDNN